MICFYIMFAPKDMVKFIFSSMDSEGNQYLRYRSFPSSCILYHIVTIAIIEANSYMYVCMYIFILLSIGEISSPF